MKNDRVAILTSAEHPQLYGDEQQLLTLAVKEGLNFEAVVWNDPDLDLDDYDAFIIRSTWDYRSVPTEFERFLDSLNGRAVQNPVSILKWNMNKRYLLDLERMGVKIPDTVIIPAGNVLKPVHPNASKWNEIIVKPAIGGGADGVTKTTMQELPFIEADYREKNPGKDIVIQAFVPEVQGEGEWSLLFFDGTFSHAAIKTPAPGDFRVQGKFGGKYAPKKPSSTLLLHAEAILKRVPSPLLYARVDVIVSGSDILLMELELIEPWLFLNEGPGSPERFVQATKRMLHL